MSLQMKVYRAGRSGGAKYAPDTATGTGTGTGTNLDAAANGTAIENAIAVGELPTLPDAEKPRAAPDFPRGATGPRFAAFGVEQPLAQSDPNPISIPIPVVTAIPVVAVPVYALQSQPLMQASLNVPSDADATHDMNTTPATTAATAAPVMTVGGDNQGVEFDTDAA